VAVARIDVGGVMSISWNNMRFEDHKCLICGDVFQARTIEARELCQKCEREKREKQEGETKA